MIPHNMSSGKQLFSIFDVSRQVFFHTPLSLAIVNLKPLVPGHVLVLPQRVVPRLSDLRSDEVTDLFLAVQQVGRVIEKAYKADALTVSLQDGIVAGQSVPHVHIHILPRHTTGPFSENKDDMYPALEASEGSLMEDLKENDRRDQGGMTVPKDDDRMPRSEQDMQKEAEWLSAFF